MILYAKKKFKDGRQPTLAEHTRDVIDAFQTLFGTPENPTWLGKEWSRFFKLNEVDAFLCNGFAACAFHDIGKANDGFQAEVNGQRGRQLIRHEHLSSVLLTYPDVWQWLSENADFDFHVVLAAVVGHHLKANDTEIGQPQGDIDQILELQRDNDELPVREDHVTLPKGLLDSLPRLWAFRGADGIEDLGESLDRTQDRLADLDDNLRTNEPRRRMLWAVRAALIAADAAGSGLYREGKHVKEWIREAFFKKRCETDADDGRLTHETVEQKIVRPKLMEIDVSWDERNNFWNGFQRACGKPENVSARALLLAPCGSGKTLAAWRWIAARCAEKPRASAIFLYPTRGTATEGYRGYVSFGGSEDAALVHGTADLDLDDIHADLPSEDRIQQARLFALRQWPKRLFSATVDQFLGFLQHGYGPTCHLPLLVDSVVVFDEIHSYDRGMFSALLEFLKHFDVPVLCMTATLLEGRQERLRCGSPELGDAGLHVINGLEFEDDADQLKLAADHPRHSVHTVAGADEAEKRVRLALKDNVRVLWVVNTVDRAQEIARRFAVDLDAEQLTTPEGARLYCYHSRFKLNDRKGWHNEVVRAFKRKADKPEPILAITTQVCEMSLDLDADMLVTEHAPASSLVQRMGRCCRDSCAHLRKPKRTGEILLYEPPGDTAEQRIRPYTDRDMEGAEWFITKLEESATVSQNRLTELLDNVPTPAELPKACRFIESGPWASVGEENFRDIDERNRQALLPGDDVEDYVRLRNSKRRQQNEAPWQAQALLVPVPRKFAKQVDDNRLPPWLSIADGGTYLPALGFCIRD